MQPIKNSAHIRTSRNIKRFRSCRHPTGVQAAHPDLTRRLFEDRRLTLKQQHLLWYADQWNKHLIHTRQMKVR